MKTKRAKIAARLVIGSTIVLSVRTTLLALFAVFVATLGTWLAIVPIDRGELAGETMVLALPVRLAVATLLIVKWR